MSYELNDLTRIELDQLFQGQKQSTVDRYWNLVQSRKAGLTFREAGEKLGQVTAGRASQMYSTVESRRRQIKDKTMAFPEMMGLSVRAENSMLNGGLTTRAGIEAAWKSKRVLRHRGLGPKTYLEIGQWLGLLT